MVLSHIKICVFLFLFSSTQVSAFFYAISELPSTRRNRNMYIYILCPSSFVFSKHSFFSKAMVMFTLALQIVHEKHWKDRSIERKHLFDKICLRKWDASWIKETFSYKISLSFQGLWICRCLSAVKNVGALWQLYTIPSDVNISNFEEYKLEHPWRFWVELRHPPFAAQTALFSRSPKEAVCSLAFYN